MKIQIKAQGKGLTLRLPTWLLLSRGAARLLRRTCHGHTEILKSLPPQALPAFFAELRRIKKKYGHWDLVEVESADGACVHIRL